MSIEVMSMLKKVIIYSTAMGIVFTIVVCFMFKQAALMILAGVFVGTANFILNSISTELVLNKFKNGYAPFYVLSFVVRISLVALIGFLVFTYNKYNVFAFMGGYLIHLIGIYIYSMKVNKELR